MDLPIKHEGDEVHHRATFVSHYISGKCLFVKGTTEKDNIPERFMPIQQAYETDDSQLYRYAEENDLLFRPKIREVFEANLSKYGSSTNKMTGGETYGEDG
jgi:hypothetical protein